MHREVLSGPAPDPHGWTPAGAFLNDSSVKDEARPRFRVQSCSAEESRKGLHDVSSTFTAAFKKKIWGFTLGNIRAVDRSHNGILSVIDH